MLNCKYCYVPDSPEYNSTSCNDDMDWDTAKKAIDVFKSIVSRNGQKKVHIRFHGGEPFLNFELIKRAVIYAEEVFNDKEIVFHTNSCHTLRHTFATRLCESGINVKVIQDVLGHADISTTMDIYVDVMDELKKREIASFDSYMAKSRETILNMGLQTL